MIRPLLICTVALMGMASSPMAAVELDQDTCSYTERHDWVASYIQVSPDGTRSQVPGHWVVTRIPVGGAAPVRSEEPVRVVYTDPEPRVVYVDPPPVYAAPVCEPSRVVIRIGDGDGRERHEWRDHDEGGWRARGSERREVRFDHADHGHFSFPLLPLLLPPLLLFHHH
jgi:hypothetical protein